MESKTLIVVSDDREVKAQLVGSTLAISVRYGTILDVIVLDAKETKLVMEFLKESTK